MRWDGLGRSESLCEVRSERQRRGYWKGVVYWSVNVEGGGGPGD